MGFDLNSADKQRTFEPIPDGQFCKLLLQIKPNGQSFAGCEKIDEGLFKFGTTTDAIMLECEFTVLEGPYVHRKFVEHWTVAGGALDDKGHSKGFSITKTRMRAAIESNQNIRPDDESPQAKATRQISGFKDLDGITFFAKIKEDPGQEYTDRQTGAVKMGFPQNGIDRIVTPDMAEYADLAAGKPVEPKPRSKAHIGAKTAAGAPAPAARSWGAAKPAELPLAQTTQAAGQPAATPAVNKPAWLRK